MSERISEKEPSELLIETGHHDHDAYGLVDGKDPDWPLFYAGSLPARLWDRLGRLRARSELVHLLVAADKAFQATGRERKQGPGF